MEKMVIWIVVYRADRKQIYLFNSIEIAVPEMAGIVCFWHALFQFTLYLSVDLRTQRLLHNAQSARKSVAIRCGLSKVARSLATRIPTCTPYPVRSLMAKTN